MYKRQYQCSSLTSFPLLNVSSGTNFVGTWFGCSSLTSFPLLDVSSGTNFSAAWRLCTSLTSFPLLDVSSGTNFTDAWRQCTSLTSFPLLDVSNATNFSGAWYLCSSLQTFPANIFDSVTATNFANAFTSTNLSSQSIENIVVSIDTAGQSNGTLDITGGGNATTATAQTAIDNLRGRGWTVTVPDGYVSALLDVFPGAAAAYSLRGLSVNTTNVVRVRRSSDNAEADFTATEITDGTLLSWVGNTASDNGYVTTWYDQAGSNDATQATASQQPKIVDAGVLVEENGKPAVSFDGVDDYLFKVFSLDVTLGYTNFYVCNITNSVTRYILASVKNTSNRYAIGINDAGNYQSTKRTAAITSDAATYTSGQVLLSDNEAPEIYLDGVLGSASVGTLNNAFSSEILIIGKNSVAAGAQHVSGVIQEIILYNSDQSSNRTGIETNINNHYNIYP